MAKTKETKAEELIQQGMGETEANIRAQIWDEDRKGTGTYRDYSSQAYEGSVNDL